MTHFSLTGMLTGTNHPALPTSQWYTRQSLRSMTLWAGWRQQNPRLTLRLCVPLHC